MINEVRNLKKENFKLNNSIVKKIGIRKEHNLEYLLDPSFFKMISSLKTPKSKDDIIDYSILFTKEDFDFMKCQVKKSTINYWSDIIDEKKLNTGNTLEKKELFYSIPIFSNNKDYAFLYVESSEGGSLKVYSKGIDGWSFVALGFFYTSD
jgi:hypothetical protein